MNDFVYDTETSAAFEEVSKELDATSPAPVSPSMRPPVTKTEPAVTTPVTPKRRRRKRSSKLENLTAEQPTQVTTRLITPLQRRQLRRFAEDLGMSTQEYVVLAINNQLKLDEADFEVQGYIKSENDEE